MRIILVPLKDHLKELWPNSDHQWQKQTKEYKNKQKQIKERNYCGSASCVAIRWVSYSYILYGWRIPASPPFKMVIGSFGPFSYFNLFNSKTSILPSKVRCVSKFSVTHQYICQFLKRVVLIGCCCQNIDGMILRRNSLRLCNNSPEDLSNIEFGKEIIRCNDKQFR